MAFDFKTSLVRSNLMRKIKSQNTKPEMLLRKALWTLGFRYRVNLKSLPGKPDIVFLGPKLCVFIDGEFWHGKDWEKKMLTIKSNREYWIPKIERNISRDKKANLMLAEQGWKVLRFWSKDVMTNTESCIEKIRSELQ